MNDRTIERRTFRYRVMLGVLLAVLGCQPFWCAHAQTPATENPKPESQNAGPRIGELRAGLAGQFKVGCWTPFTVELEAGGEDVEGLIELVVPDGDGVPSRVHAPASGTLTLPAGKRTSVLLYAKVGQITADISITFQPKTGPAVTRVFRAGADGPLAGVVPSNASLVVRVGKLPNEKKEGAAVALPYIQLDSIAELPPEWWGLEGIDSILLFTSAPDFAEQLAACPDQFAALKTWIQMGGRLVLSVGQQAESLLAPGEPLAALIPGVFDSIVPLRQSTVFEAYAESSEPLAPGVQLKLEIARLRDTRGKIEAFAGKGPQDLPLVVRSPWGFGEVVFAGFDLDRDPVASWVARPLLLQRLLDQANRKTSDDGSDMLGAVTTLGFVDLSGQLRGALDQFPGVRLVPFWLVALLVTLYLVCIGPLDYYFVRKILRRPAATWITFSLTVVLFSAGAMALAYGLKGRELRVNQLDLVDFDAESQFIRGTTWTNVFSPAIDTYDLSLETEAVQTNTESFSSAGQGGSGGESGSGILFSWFGLTGNGFGGMDVRGSANGGMGTASRSLPLFTLAYDYSAPLDRIENVPIAVWASKSFVGRWWSQGSGDIQAQLTDEGRLVGTISNNGSTALTSAVLIYDKWAYVIRNFEPGTEIDLGIDVDPQTVDTFLRNVRAQGDRTFAESYDQASFDIPRIVQMMTAHELAGGQAYTALAHHYQPFVELSRLVKDGRAMLIGRVSKAAVQLNRDGKPLATEAGQSQHWTYHRYAFPVAEAIQP